MMIQMTTAFTLEVDDAEYALEEILEQLDLPNNQLKNSAAIMHFHSDFVETGVAAEIAEQLPFDVVGCSTFESMNAEMDDSLILTVALFSSDEVQFTVFTADIEEDASSIVTAADAAKLDDEAGLVLAFCAPLSPILHEVVVNTISEALGDVAVFGICSCDHSPDFSNSFTLLNGEISQKAVSALVLWGEVDPVFSYSELNRETVRRQEFLVTKVEGNAIVEINDAPFRAFLASAGFSENASIEELGGVPLIVNHNDGTQPVACSTIALSEEGHGLVNVMIPVGATISIGTVEQDDVLRLTRETLENVLKADKTQGLILAPCASHFYTVEANAQAQRDIISQMVPEGMPYHLAYAGGEICPAYGDNGELRNRFHNYTLVACAF